MSKRHIVIAGGGAAGFFAAITCAEAAPDSEVTLLEQGPRFLSKVRISGGGRCNVTHACFDVDKLSHQYPRGGAALRGPFERFQPRDTVAWFETRGVRLKTEPDGRMFPVSDSSQTIIDCLLRAARQAGVILADNLGLARVSPRVGGFDLALANGAARACDRLMLATGGCRGTAAGSLPVSLGHSVEPPVPSLFTFRLESAWLRGLAGICVGPVELMAPGLGLRERGPVLLTHEGLSGPAVLRLSAWGARALHGLDYRFPLQVNWVPDLEAAAIARELERQRASQPARLVVNGPVGGLPARLWTSLVLAAGIARQTRWADLSKSQRHRLGQGLTRSELAISGKSLNRDEFVTCGGVPLGEVNLRTMQSKRCPGLYFGGELLDIDGLTGGFNFQAAWTTGWIAGQAMAAA